MKKTDSSGQIVFDEGDPIYGKDGDLLDVASGTTCCARTSTGGDQCRISVSVRREGRGYCGLHDPVKVKSRKLNTEHIRQRDKDRRKESRKTKIAVELLESFGGDPVKACGFVLGAAGFTGEDKLDVYASIILTSLGGSLRRAEGLIRRIGKQFEEVFDESLRMVRPGGRAWRAEIDLDVKTGPVRFGNGWDGLFIRADDLMLFRCGFEGEHELDIEEIMRDFDKSVRGSLEFEEDYGPLQLRPWTECVLEGDVHGNRRKKSSGTGEM